MGQDDARRISKEINSIQFTTACFCIEPVAFCIVADQSAIIRKGANGDINKIFAIIGINNNDVE